MPAFLLSPLIRYGIIAAVIVLLGLAVFWYRHEAGIARESQKLAESRATLAEQDAARWQAAAADRDAAVKQRDMAIAAQSAEIDRVGALAQKATQEAARQVEAAARDARAAFVAQIQALEEEAHAHPEQIVPLGPLVRARVNGLWK